MKFFITLNKLNLIYGTLNSLGSVSAASSDRARPSKKFVNIAIFHVYGEDIPSHKKKLIALRHMILFSLWPAKFTESQRVLLLSCIIF
jgi:hypothetical protein